MLSATDVNTSKIQLTVLYLTVANKRLLMLLFPCVSVMMIFGLADTTATLYL